MKKFLLKILLFLSPVLFIPLLEAFLPPTLFTFRTWEGLSFKNGDITYAPFYPNEKITTNSVGDLCHHTNKAVQKKEFWITDKLGYRNDEFVDEADILFIGDSFIAGSSLSQDETISNQVKSKYNNKRKIYNLAPATFSQFRYYLKTGVIKKPKVVVFSIVERNVPRPLMSFKENNLRTNVIKTLEVGRMNVYIDKGLKLFSIKWLQARLRGYKGSGIPAVGDSTMYFEQGVSQKHSKKDLFTAVSIIKSYQKYCDSQGIKFIFMPMPDKESVYYELVPFSKQPDYLFQLDSLLHRENIATINTLKIYNDFRSTNSKLLYHTDDSHWNVTATELIASEIVKQAKN